MILFEQVLKEGDIHSFEKDDELHVRFVISASNLRSHCFGIAMTTE